MMKPRILISGVNSSRESYEKAIIYAGGEPVFAYLPEVDDSYDGLLLSGGGDIDPARFGQENMGSRFINPDRDRVEFALAEAYLRAGKPILGICRGHQVVNVVLGGTLIQDISEPQRQFHTHSRSGMARFHPVWCQEDSFLYNMYGPLFHVNSFHHQALDRMGEGLRVSAWSESGLIEAAEHETLPVRTVQWHPERMAYTNLRPDTVDGAAIFQWFLEAAKR